MFGRDLIYDWVIYWFRVGAPNVQIVLQFLLIKYSVICCALSVFGSEKGCIYLCRDEKEEIYCPIYSKSFESILQA